ncbi:MAG TPA: hypothetical protein VGC24_01310 [Burkholderiaceae bacterium]
MKIYLSLSELQRIRYWHARHKKVQPLENQVFDAVLTLWLMGWVGWLAVAVLGPMLVPLCLLGMAAPALYVQWRLHAQQHGALRCDWLAVVPAHWK